MRRDIPRTLRGAHPAVIRLYEPSGNNPGNPVVEQGGLERAVETGETRSPAETDSTRDEDGSTPISYYAAREPYTGVLTKLHDTGKLSGRSC